MSHSIDNPFISQEEQKHENLKFLRIDADVNDTLREEVKEEDKEALKKQEETLTETFKKALGDDKLQVKVEKLKDAEISSMITLSEETRRMQDMMKMSTWAWTRRCSAAAVRCWYSTRTTSSFSTS